MRAKLQPTGCFQKARRCGIDPAGRHREKRTFADWAIQSQAVSCMGQMVHLATLAKLFKLDSQRALSKPALDRAKQLELLSVRDKEQ
jgi:hypothetical protein